MQTPAQSAIIAAAYLAGSIPSGVVLARLAGGADPRRVGSGNIGATNVMRAMGPVAAAVTLVADVAKGVLSVVAARWLFPGSALLPFLAGGAAILGHNFPVFLGFRGGKGVATTFGALLALDPLLALVLLAVWLGTAVATRISSAGALAAAGAAPLAALALGRAAPLVWFAAGIALLLVARHHANIRRLLAGTESRIELGRKNNPAERE
jgi:acyl phosphate:glycerol-3-phosphate acyltransferase